MINKIALIKKNYNNLGNYTRFAIKTTLIFVISCLIASFVCFILKDYTDTYIFLHRVSGELLIAARSCAGLGVIFSIIGIKTEK